MAKIRVKGVDADITNDDKLKRINEMFSSHGDFDVLLDEKYKVVDVQPNDSLALNSFQDWQDNISSDAKSIDFGGSTIDLGSGEWINSFSDAILMSQGSKVNRVANFLSQYGIESKVDRSRGEGAADSITGVFPKNEVGELNSIRMREAFKKGGDLVLISGYDDEGNEIVAHEEYIDPRSIDKNMQEIAQALETLDPTVGDTVEFATQHIVNPKDITEKAVELYKDGNFIEKMQASFLEDAYATLNNQQSFVLKEDFPALHAAMGAMTTTSRALGTVYGQVAKAVTGDESYAQNFFDIESGITRDARQAIYENILETNEQWMQEKSDEFTYTDSEKQDRNKFLLELDEHVPGISSDFELANQKMIKAETARGGEGKDQKLFELQILRSLKRQLQDKIHGSAIQSMRKSGEQTEVKLQEEMRSNIAYPALENIEDRIEALEPDLTPPGQWGKKTLMGLLSVLDDPTLLRSIGKLGVGAVKGGAKKTAMDEAAAAAAKEIAGATPKSASAAVKKSVKAKSVGAIRKLSKNILNTVLPEAGGVSKLFEKYFDKQLRKQMSKQGLDPEDFEGALKGYRKDLMTRTPGVRYVRQLIEESVEAGFSAKGAKFLAAVLEETPEGVKNLFKIKTLDDGVNVVVDPRTGKELFETTLDQSSLDAILNLRTNIISGNLMGSDPLAILTKTSLDKSVKASRTFPKIAERFTGMFTRSKDDFDTIMQEAKDSGISNVEKLKAMSEVTANSDYLKAVKMLEDGSTPAQINSSMTGDGMVQVSIQPAEGGQSNLVVQINKASPEYQALPSDAKSGYLSMQGSFPYVGNSDEIIDGIKQIGVDGVKVGGKARSVTKAKDENIIDAEIVGLEIPNTEYRVLDNGAVVHSENPDKAVGFVYKNADGDFMPETFKPYYANSFVDAKNKTMMDQLETFIPETAEMIKILEKSGDIPKEKLAAIAKDMENLLSMQFHVTDKKVKVQGLLKSILGDDEAATLLVSELRKTSKSLDRTNIREALRTGMMNNLKRAKMNLSKESLENLENMSMEDYFKTVAPNLSKSESSALLKLIRDSKSGKEMDLNESIAGFLENMTNEELNVFLDMFLTGTATSLPATDVFDMLTSMTKLQRDTGAFNLQPAMRDMTEYNARIDKIRKSLKEAIESHVTDTKNVVGTVGDGARITPEMSTEFFKLAAARETKAETLDFFAHAFGQHGNAVVGANKSGELTRKLFDEYFLKAVKEVTDGEGTYKANSSLFQSFVRLDELLEESGYFAKTGQEKFSDEIMSYSLSGPMMHNLDQGALAKTKEIEMSGTAQREAKELTPIEADIGRPALKGEAPSVVKKATAWTGKGSLSAEEQYVVAQKNLNNKAKRSMLFRDAASLVSKIIKDPKVRAPVFFWRGYEESDRRNLANKFLDEKFEKLANNKGEKNTTYEPLYNALKVVTDGVFGFGEGSDARSAVSDLEGVLNPTDLNHFVSSSDRILTDNSEHELGFSVAEIPNRGYMLMIQPPGSDNFRMRYFKKSELSVVKSKIKQLRAKMSR